jgi:hypothetical protein
MRPTRGGPWTTTAVPVATAVLGRLWRLTGQCGGRCPMRTAMGTDRRAAADRPRRVADPGRGAAARHRAGPVAGRGTPTARAATAGAGRLATRAHHRGGYPLSSQKVPAAVVQEASGRRPGPHARSNEPPSARRATVHRVHSRPARGRVNERSLRVQPPQRGGTRAEDAAQGAGRPVGPEDDVAARVERECAEQGIPVAIDDPVTIAKIITLVRAGHASTSATRAAKSARRGRPSGSARGR